MTSNTELEEAITMLLQGSEEPIPVTLMNHSPPLMYEIICGVVERCGEKGVKIREIFLDPLVARSMGLNDGETVPIHTTTHVRYQPALGRRVLFHT